MTFIDESIFRIEPIVKHGWFLKGSKPSCPVNWSRGKECVFGAINFENGDKLISKQAKRINSKTFIEFTQKLMKDIGSFVLVMDNAPWHTSRKASGFLEEVRDCVEPVHLPPYSPELNPVELYWKVLRSNLANRLFKNTSGLRKSLEKALNGVQLNINKQRYLTS
ncbi:hypothetical protein AKJ39_03380 [candidate division MSBL1 archaeon SCGC-AAA259J03]|uniref:Tc1-like transposase DDE domain-containing protein n=1 Tax=candidate division MSBL1 archaeon SCGC-AAA259J03 TaxID=1698269 RepID=A0A656YXJ2_9EURY|nr:hypothetical protein AKJ39_03380 [candidate division MSBL1 archaeon SCGC-AAA259J03]